MTNSMHTLQSEVSPLMLVGHLDMIGVVMSNAVLLYNSSSLLHRFREVVESQVSSGVLSGQEGKLLIDHLDALNMQVDLLDAAAWILRRTRDSIAESNAIGRETQYVTAAFAAEVIAEDLLDSND